MSEDRATLSASTLNLLRECERCFWLAVKKNLRRPRGPMPSIATGLDSFVTRYFHYYRKRGQLPPLLSGKLSGHLAGEELFDLKKGVKAKWLVYEDHRLTLVGKLDDCLVEAEGYSPLDYKTRASLPEEIHQSYQLQMDIYTFLLAKNKSQRYPVSGRAYLLYFVPAFPEVQEEFELEKMERLHFPFKAGLKVLTTCPESIPGLLDHAAEILQREEPPSPGECEYCQWAQQWKEQADTASFPVKAEAASEEVQPEDSRETLF
ncbi:MAG TPA: PD-(D/E)XK nuclease family protein [bacterium]|nr:PD-(D/E)XK nuclease family protein [bacterium]